MFFSPLSILFFVLFFFLFLFIFAFIHIGLITIAFERIGLNEAQAFWFLILSLLGSSINIPIKKIAIPTPEPPLQKVVRYYGMVYRVPQPREEQHSMIIAINLGGAIVPFVLSMYLMVKWGLFMEAIISTSLVAAVTYYLAKPVPGVGIAVPVFIPPLLAAAITLFVDPSLHSPALAYISATMGTLLGADILHLKDLKKIHAPVASIGGAGTFDGIFLAGIIAVILA